MSSKRSFSYDTITRCVIIVNNYIKKETYVRGGTRFCVFRKRFDIKQRIFLKVCYRVNLFSHATAEENNLMVRISTFNLEAFSQ
jgi:uncharacterized membrane protein